MKKRCLLTGITGSGASYLAEYILENHPDWEIWGISRWHSTSVLSNIKNIKDKIVLRECDLNDLSSIIRVLQECRPEKIWHMAATANVHVSFITPLAILQNNIMGTANLLEAVRLICPETIFNLCSTSEIYGLIKGDTAIDEQHPTRPINCYAVSKLAADSLGYAYFKSWKLKVITTRAFAYLNARRRDLFATSFALQVAKIEQGKQKILHHGNLESVRTVMSIYDMAEAYWIGSERCAYGEAYNLGGKYVLSVGGFLEILKSKANIPIVSQLDEKLLRPADTDRQICNSLKFYRHTGWEPKITLDDAVDRLLNDCREIVKNEEGK